jgi:uncharacterized membrane protein
VTVIYILWLREVKRYVRSRPQIIASLAQPLLYLLVLGFGLGPVTNVVVLAGVGAAFLALGARAFSRIQV